MFLDFSQTPHTHAAPDLIMSAVNEVAQEVTKEGAKEPETKEPEVAKEPEAAKEPEVAKEPEAAKEPESAAEGPVYGPENRPEEAEAPP